MPTRKSNQAAATPAVVPASMPAAAAAELEMQAWTAEQRAAIEADVREQLLREAQAKLQAGRRRRAYKDGQGSGPLPYGYVRATQSLRDRDGELLAERGDIVIDEKAAAVIRRILAWHRAGLDTIDIAMQLEVAGIRTTRGVLWNESSVRAVLAHEQLYRTGVRTWGGIKANELWPVILCT